ncbi:TonB-dependent receptor [Pseudomonas sp.]|uniref:TonB-dependent receptor n=1 Tax=Pseudomonas sp. TaxID=306 RepID=UPI003D0EF90B
MAVAFGKSRVRRYHRLTVSMIPLLSAISAPMIAHAQDAAAAPEQAGQPGEIIVTAQKRSQRINSVPMSITAASGDQLAKAGINDVGDLQKITPGFTTAQSTSGTPVYTLRGVGYNDIALGARPAVTVYLDEAPIPYALQTRGASMDLERVEVLKGPQGTLFGNNSTGGAINYIAAKPTDHFEGGITGTYGRFNQIDLSGYVSAPLTDTLAIRIAGEHRSQGNWQKSYTRDESLGKVDFTNLRGIAVWKPSDRFTAQLTVSRWIDNSDTQAAQLVQIVPTGPASLLPVTGLAGYPLAPHKARAADWGVGSDLSRRDRYFQATGRIDYDLADQVTLTSQTNYIDYKNDAFRDTDGTTLQLNDMRQLGGDKSFSQELRISGNFDRANVVAGVSYSHDKPTERDPVYNNDTTLAYALATPAGIKFDSYTLLTTQKVDNYAAFGNLEYNLTQELTLQGGVRYTKTNTRFEGCSLDSGNGHAAAVWGARFGTTIPAGGCWTLNVNTGAPGLINSKLKEDNVSWRAGVQYKVRPGSLLYANVSKGYKAGGYATLASPLSAGFDPAVQESVLAYEAGFKTDLGTRMVQLNGAVFYYDYRDKQVTGTVNLPGLGPVAKLVNIPKSSITGGELQVTVTPTTGLTLNVGGTYLDAKIGKGFVNPDPLGTVRDFDGTRLPNVPKFQLSSSLDYETPISDTLKGFGGVSVYHQSSQNTLLGEVPVFRAKAYTLTDLQLGVEASDNSWRAFIWGRNVFNQYYWTSTVKVLDVLSRYAGRPATYGATVSFKFQ